MKRNVNICNGSQQRAEQASPTGARAKQPRQRATVKYKQQQKKTSVESAKYGTVSAANERESAKRQRGRCQVALSGRQRGGFCKLAAKVQIYVVEQKWQPRK